MQVRPSGATVKVLKAFTSLQECREQARLMNSAGPAIALPASMCSDLEFTMPLATARVPTSAFPALLDVYHDLWALPNPRPRCTRDEYHAYVMGRTLPEGYELERAYEFLDATKAALQRFFDNEVASLPVEQEAFVHGDATVSNAVFTRGGPRLIDFSVRPTPPEREIDLAKLTFSSLGFDLGPQRQEALTEALRRFKAAVPYSQTLLAYYLLSHVVRVFTREPPRYVGQHLFYFSVVEHAEAIM